MTTIVHGQLMGKKSHSKVRELFFFSVTQRSNSVEKKYDDKKLYLRPLITSCILKASRNWHASASSLGCNLVHLLYVTHVYNWRTYAVRVRKHQTKKTVLINRGCRMSIPSLHFFSQLLVPTTCSTHGDVGVFTMSVYLSLSGGGGAFFGQFRNYLRWEYWKLYLNPPLGEEDPHPPHTHADIHVRAHCLLHPTFRHGNYSGAWCATSIWIAYLFLAQHIWRDRQMCRRFGSDKTNLACHTPSQVLNPRIANKLGWARLLPGSVWKRILSMQDMTRIRNNLFLGHMMLYQ